MLPIFDVAVSGFGRAIRSLPRVLGIYWLPWLLGTVAVLILELRRVDRLQALLKGPSPSMTMTNRLLFCGNA